MSPRWSWDGVPSANSRKRRRRSRFLSPKRAMSALQSPPARPAGIKAGSRPAGTSPCHAAGDATDRRKYRRKTTDSAKAPAARSSVLVVVRSTQPSRRRRFRRLAPCHPAPHPIVQFLELAPMTERGVARCGPPARSAVRAANRRRLPHAVFEYFPSSLSMAVTFPADDPLASNCEASQVSTIAFANSGPTTRAPSVMIWALLLVEAFPAE